MEAPGTAARSAARVAFVALLLALFPSALRANTFVAFGPQEYVRGNSAPAPQTTAFNVLDPTTTYTLRLDVRGVSSAVVTLNGAEVVRPSDFNANTTQITRRVTLKAANQLKVELRGKPGGSLTLQVIGDDHKPPAIKGVLTPAPNASGWNNASPTVVFVCSDETSGIVSCSGPVTVGAETAGRPVSGTAVDKAGNTATASVLVKFDGTPPALNVASPAGGAKVFTTPLPVGGAVADALSGLARVTCNGAPAVVNGADFSCGVPLTPGLNSVEVLAVDVAGNAGRSALSLTYTPVPAVVITSPANLSYHNISPTTVTGTVDDPSATVTVNSVPAAVVNGRFSVALPLAEGPNTVTASATSPAGATGTASVRVTLDTTPPRVTVTSPADGFKTTDAVISVGGSVNDIVVGTVNEEQAQVSVNGVAAQVSNRTFLSVDVPLNVGANVIRAVGRDRVGNAATTEITVTRQAPTGARIRLVAGNNQTGAVGSVLPSPLLVALSDPAGGPVSNRPVIFKVIQNDGLVGAGGVPAPTVIATTDAEGRAEARWKLGMRAGAGGNTVEAYAVGFEGTAVFSATGAQGPAGKIVVDTGNEQSGVVNQPLPKPLIAVVVDGGNNRLANVPVTFTVRGGGGNIGGRPTFTINTDSDGRAAATLTLGLHEGNANNLVEVDFPSNEGLPAGFTASGRAAGDPAKTTISGVVLDNSNVPIPGVTLRAVLTNVLNSNGFAVQTVPAVRTDAQGQFTIPQAPVGFVKLFVDGTTAERPGVYPTLDYDMVTVAGHDNTVGLPIFLLPLNTANQLCVTATTGGGTLNIREAPGFSLSFGPGQVTFPGGSKAGCISVTVVHGDKMPMVPGFGQQPRFIVTIQPAGAVFNPPARITLPNVDGLRPREVTEMYSFDHDIGAFVAIGTGTVSDDGMVIRSDPGVGVLKAGWHCGGNPNQTGSTASLSVNLSAASSEVTAGSTVDLTAHGSPPLDGQYVNWEVVDDPADPNDDQSVGSFETTPTCDDQPSCIARLKGRKLGVASVRVSFTCKMTGGTVTSSIVKVRFKLGLKVKELGFGRDIVIHKDRSGVEPEAIRDPVWKDTNTPEQNNPAAYPRNTKMKVEVTFAVDPVPPSPVSDVTIEGEIPGLGKFVKTGVTIPSAPTVTVSDIEADTPLPNTTKFYDPLTINWRHMADGAACPNCTEDGSTSHRIYVTLATPIWRAYLTPLHLAVSDDGAADEPTAFRKTWAKFAGPANTRGWDERPLFYYREGVGFKDCAKDEEALLIHPEGSGQCGAWARLLMATLGINGIRSERVTIGTKDSTFFLVKDWNYGTPSFPDAPEYKWRLAFNPAAVAAEDRMVPKQPGNIYGDMMSFNTLAGQNTAPPSEKAFKAHYIVRVNLSGVSPSFYDPSYGVTYTDADDFEDKAVEGYFTHFFVDPAHVFRLRRSTGQRNILFDW